MQQENDWEHEENSSDQWSHIRQSNIYALGFAKGRKERQDRKTAEEILAKSFQNVIKKLYTHRLRISMNPHAREKNSMKENHSKAYQNQIIKMIKGKSYK